MWNSTPTDRMEPLVKTTLATPDEDEVDCCARRAQSFYAICLQKIPRVDSKGSWSPNHHLGRAPESEELGRFDRVRLSHHLLGVVSNVAALWSELGNVEIVKINRLRRRAGNLRQW